jgi:uncharacterized lipoprotein YmbA
MIGRQRSFVLVLLLLIGGCLRPSPEVVFHTLQPLSLGEATVAPAGKALALEILPVQMPELLQRSQIVLLEGTGVHRLSPAHRWGNTLEKDMQRVLIENLAVLLGSEAVVPYPMGDRVQAKYRIALDVQQCAGAPGGTVQLRATWMATQLSDGRTVLLRRLNLKEPVNGGSIEELVSAHSRVMNRLSQEIASALKALMEKP